jgi:hypothetical protein
MSSLAFDTHKFVTDLNKAGMDTPMAEVLAKHYADLLNDRIATKDDLSVLRMELKGDMTALEERISVKVVTAQLASFIGTCAVIAAFFALSNN